MRDISLGHAIAITGDASKMDHSLGTQVATLKAEFVTSFYQKKWVCHCGREIDLYFLIKVMFEHTIWPVLLD